MNTTNGRWAKNFDCCIKCGRTSLGHAGHGNCTGCAGAFYSARHPDRARAAKEKWYRKFKRQGGLKILQQKRELEHFDGMREAALKRDGYRCVRCSSGVALTVHHKDGNGRNRRKPDKNNALENLETLCRACHMKEHKEKIETARAKRFNYWSPKHKLQACVECGKSSQRHRRDGYCGTCFAREEKRLRAAGTWKPKPPGGRGEPWK